MIFLLDFRFFSNSLQYLLMKLISKMYGYGCVLVKIAFLDGQIFGRYYNLLLQMLCLLHSPLLQSIYQSAVTCDVFVMKIKKNKINVVNQFTD